MTRTVSIALGLGIWLCAGLASAQAGSALGSPRLAPMPAPEWASEADREVPQWLRLELAHDRARIREVGVALPITFFALGIAATVVGGVMAGYGLMGGEGEVSAGGFALGVAGLVSWISSLLVWRDARHQRRAIADRMEERRRRVMGR